MLILFISALSIGISLGLLGAGGSVMTIPVLVYWLGHGVKESVTESMAIVGIISLAALVPYAKAQKVDWRSVWDFGVPGVLGTLIGAWLGGMSTEALQLVALGSMLLLAAVIMIRNPLAHSREKSVPCRSFGMIAIDGIVVGIATGFVGVGGGFLIIPALVHYRKMSMRLAIGTSLAIIVIKAAVGYVKYQHYLQTHELVVNTQTIVIFSIIGIAGSRFGSHINMQMKQYRLRQAFAGFLILLGGFVVVHETSELLESPLKQSPAHAIRVVE